MVRSKALKLWHHKDLWAPTRRIEEEYRRAIQRLMHKILGTLVGLNDPSDILAALLNTTNDPVFVRYAEAAAIQMVTGMFRDSGKNWREAAAKNGQGAVLYQYLMKEMSGPLGNVMNEHIRRNADFIRSVPSAIAKQMTPKIMDMQMAGLRANDIAQELLKMYPDMSQVKATLIARTEAAKTSSNLVQARAEIMQAPWYKWQTSEDSRVRESHKKMDQVLVRWSDPPSPERLAKEKPVGHYHAGCIWNCRCYPEVVLELDLIEWPAKVYLNGSIHRMTRREFERLLPNKKVAI